MKTITVGVPKEIKNSEHRVAITPSGVKEFKKYGHRFLIESNAGLESGFTNADYAASGAEIVNTAEEVWTQSEMIIKVKEPQPSEYKYLRPELLLFTYFHLAAELELAQELIKSKVNTIAYETVQLKDGSLPLLTPMSEIAGKMSVQIGASLLEHHHGGRGLLPGGVPGVDPADIVIIGAGTVGMNAAKIAYGMGANVTVLNRGLNKLRYISDIFNDNVRTLIANEDNIYRCVTNADLVIGAVLNAGAKAPKLITENMVKNMRKGAVIVDVAIDQGGITETIDHTTTHDNPYYEKYGVLHYAVPNIPGAVPRTSTVALTNATLPYAIELANKGFNEAVKQSEALYLGANTANGNIVSEPVADALNVEYTELSLLVGME